MNLFDSVIHVCIVHRTLDVVFSRFRAFSFFISPKQLERSLSLCLVIQPSMRVTPLGFCLRVIVNEKLQNLEKMRSTVLSVLLLIYACVLLLFFYGLFGASKDISISAHSQCSYNYFSLLLYIK